MTVTDESAGERTAVAEWIVELGGLAQRMPAMLWRALVIDMP